MVWLCEFWFAYEYNSSWNDYTSKQGKKQAQEEPEEADFNESLGKSAKSIRFGDVPVDDVLEESAGNWMILINDYFNQVIYLT